MGISWSKTSFDTIFCPLHYLSQDEIEALFVQSNGDFSDIDDTNFETSVNERLMNNQTDDVIKQSNRYLDLESYALPQSFSSLPWSFEYYVNTFTETCLTLNIVCVLSLTCVSIFTDMCQQHLTLCTFTHTCTFTHMRQ